MPNDLIHSADPVVIPGNSKGDGVITETAGKLLAIGPKKIEVDNPVYRGNSGSPIVHSSSSKVLGLLTEAELVTLDSFDRASFKSKNSAIKSEIRYFGYRFDSVQAWEPLNWQYFQYTENAIALARKELESLFAYFTDSSTRYKEFQDLHDARNRAAMVFNTKNLSVADKQEAARRFFRDIEYLARRARERVDNRMVYFIQKQDIETIRRMADRLRDGIAIVQREDELTTTLLQRGK